MNKFHRYLRQALNEWAPPSDSHMPWELDPTKYSPVDGGPTDTGNDDEGGYLDRFDNIVDGPVQRKDGTWWWDGREVYQGSDGNWYYMDEFDIRTIEPYIT